MNQNKINYAHLRQSESVYKAVFNYLTFVKVGEFLKNDHAYSFDLQ